MDIIVIPIVVFLAIVAPIWLILHYRSKRQVGQGLSTEELAKLEHLVHQADKMNQRLVTLESILDSETPDWRHRYGNS